MDTSGRLGVHLAEIDAKMHPIKTAVVHVDATISIAAISRSR